MLVSTCAVYVRHATIVDFRMFECENAQRSPTCFQVQMSAESEINLAFSSSMICNHDDLLQTCSFFMIRPSGLSTTDFACMIKLEFSQIINKLFGDYAILA
jgi:hypothetical protein